MPADGPQAAPAPESSNSEESRATGPPTCEVDGCEREARIIVPDRLNGRWDQFRHFCEPYHARLNGALSPRPWVPGPTGEEDLADSVTKLQFGPYGPPSPSTVRDHTPPPSPPPSPPANSVAPTVDPPISLIGSPGKIGGRRSALLSNRLGLFNQHPPSTTKLRAAIKAEGNMWARSDVDKVNKGALAAALLTMTDDPKYLPGAPEMTAQALVRDYVGLCSTECIALDKKAAESRRVAMTTPARTTTSATGSATPRKAKLPRSVREPANGEKRAKTDSAYAPSAQRVILVDNPEGPADDSKAEEVPALPRDVYSDTELAQLRALAKSIRKRAENKEANPDERKRSLIPAALSTSQRELVDDLFCGGDGSMDAFNKPTKWHREREHRVAVPVLVQYLASSTHVSPA